MVKYKTKQVMFISLYMADVRIHSLLILYPAITPSSLDSSHTAFLLILKHSKQGLCSVRMAWVSHLPDATSDSLNFIWVSA